MKHFDKHCFAKQNITMKIANPSYDVVFKYLMEENEIAKYVLSLILDKKIVALKLQPQENVYVTEDGLRMSKLDFKATVKEASGKPENVLIEVQKASEDQEEERFRLYLGLNYRERVPFLNKKGETKFTSYPITTIYFLGFRLKNVKVPILKVARSYYNAVTNEKLTVKEDFVEKLSHDMYAIQIPRLKMAVQTELEKVLDVFNVEKYKTSDSRILEYTGDISDPSIERIVKHLGRAIIKDDKLLNQMLMEELLADQWNRHQERSKNAEKRQVDAEKRQVDAEKRQVDAEKAKDDAQKAAKIAEQQKMDAEKARDDAQKNLIQQKIDADKARADIEKEADELRKRIEFLEQQARSDNKSA